MVDDVCYVAVVRIKYVEPARTTENTVFYVPNILESHQEPSLF
jgi:hypothetical protein